MAGAVMIGRAERRLEEAPIHLAGQRHQRMAHVDDLIEPRAQKIALTCVTPLFGMHPILPGKSRADQRITYRICKESTQPITFSGKSKLRRRTVSLSKSTALEMFTGDGNHSPSSQTSHLFAAGH